MAKHDRFRLTFLGAARTVTGSMHLLEVRDQSFLVDGGMYQGRRGEAGQRNRNPPRAAIDADELILTHAHIDHSGNIPTLVKRGFQGSVHCTAATAELCEAMLRDSARLQMQDAKWLNEKYKDDPRWIEVEPMYDEDDAKRALDRFVPHDYDEEFTLAQGINVRFIDAGHVLGSASALVDVKLNGHRRRIAFSGDIGRRNLPILRDPTPPDHPDYVVMETTYGNRIHAPTDDMAQQLLDAIETARARRGKIIIPSFALERTQEIVFALNQLRKDGRLQPIPIYVDSPLAVNLTEVFRRHPECYDAETIDFSHTDGDPFGFKMLTFVQSKQESMQLNHTDGPMIIISASGMCEGGRVVHHLRNSIEDARNMILIVGYQAQHTLGRRMVERRPRVKLLGMERELVAEVRVLNAFSAHADRDELLWWVDKCGSQVRNYFLVHGDEDQSEAFQQHLAARGLPGVVPNEGQSMDLQY
ncbi:MAG: MBL fold metallo-hydrolase [Polyangiaceae bacterium]|nr:MBL fold metallo-hydrolase [Polyangiaceae bacterium]